MFLGFSIDMEIALRRRWQGGWTRGWNIARVTEQNWLVLPRVQGPASIGDRPRLFSLLALPRFEDLGLPLLVVGSYPAEWYQRPSGFLFDIFPVRNPLEPSLASASHTLSAVALLVCMHAERLPSHCRQAHRAFPTVLVRSENPDPRPRICSPCSRRE